MSRTQIEDLDIPDGYELWESEYDIHIIPEDDPFDHDVEFISCWCSSTLLNKLTINESSERPIYMHNHSATARRA